MERETKTITTPVDAKVIEVKTYITGREKRALTGIYLNGKIGFDMETQKVEGIDYGVIDQAQDLAFKTVVVSVDGNSSNVVDAILNLKATDYDFVVTEINKITSGTLSEEKKTI